MKMIEKELLQKNRFTEEEYKKKVKEQFRQMLEDDSKKAVQIKKEVDEFEKAKGARTMIKTRIEEGLDSLIEMYTIEIEDDTECLKKYKDELENVLKESDCLSEVDNSRIWSLHRIVDRMANKIFLMKRFLLDLKIMKEGNK
jgi:hypothetical protein|nr:MAG TPA: hypothetical protein [Caudoviricetes sp.]